MAETAMSPRQTTTSNHHGKQKTPPALLQEVLRLNQKNFPVIISSADFGSLAVVILVNFAFLFTGTLFVRAVAEWLIFRQSAHADELGLTTDFDFQGTSVLFQDPTRHGNSSSGDL
jgi:hypothetical protein